MSTDERPIYGPFFGVMGAASAMVFSGKLSLKALKLVFLWLVSFQVVSPVNHSVNEAESIERRTYVLLASICVILQLIIFYLNVVLLTSLSLRLKWCELEWIHVTTVLFGSTQPKSRLHTSHEWHHTGPAQITHSLESPSVNVLQNILRETIS